MVLKGKVHYTWIDGLPDLTGYVDGMVLEACLKKGKWYRKTNQCATVMCIFAFMDSLVRFRITSVLESNFPGTVKVFYGWGDPSDAPHDGVRHSGACICCRMLS